MKIYVAAAICNAQGSRVIIVVVQVGAVKIYGSSSSGGTQGKGKKDETQF